MRNQNERRTRPLDVDHGMVYKDLIDPKRPRYVCNKMLGFYNGSISYDFFINLPLVSGVYFIAGV